MQKKIHIGPLGHERVLLAGCTVFIMVILLSAPSFAASAKEIDFKVDVSLLRFSRFVSGAKEYTKVAKGMLIIPNVIKAAFVIGGEYGQGCLRVDGKTVDYYSIAAASFGLQIGAQTKDIILVFMTEEALNRFRAGSGWEAGVDGNIALITIGEGVRIDTTTVKDPIVGFVLDVKGLMADVSLKGSKFTKLDK